MNFSTAIPFAIACLVSLAMGVAPWLDHASSLKFLGHAAMGFCALLWLIGDARRRKVAVGNWTGVLTFIAQPLGLAMWFWRHWKWRCWIPILAYAGVILLLSALNFAGFASYGMIRGHRFDALVDAF